MRALVVIVALVACGSGSANDLKKSWLGRKWTPVEGELKDGVRFAVEVPADFPQNKESLVGPDWWVGAQSADPSKWAGPRFSISYPREMQLADAEALARDVEPDAKRSDLVEIAKEKLADGRLRYVSAVKGNRHLDVTVWIPLDATRGVKCNAHWYAGAGDEPKTPPPPDAEIIAWLDHFCASLKLIASAKP